MSTSADIAAFDESVDGLLRKVWGDATAAETGDVDKLWAVAAEHGWFELQPAGALDLAVTATRRLGRVACPLPVFDAYAASELVGAEPIADGSVRLVLAVAPDVPLDAGGAASHVLLVPPSGGAAQLRPVRSHSRLSGLAVPAWTRAQLGETQAVVGVDRLQADRALTLTRLGKAVRALAAAEHAHELAIEHAKTRVQFGKVIGSFGAVQQRTAQCQIDIRSANLLVDEAVAALQHNRSDATLKSELAIAHATAITPRVQLAAHHTLAAIGYFNEHPAPWLFRRVHADVTLITTIELAHGSVADAMIETGARLPMAELDEAGAQFRAEFLEFLDEHYRRDQAATPMVVDTAIVEAIAGQGWLGFDWPTDYGGRQASPSEQLVLNEESTYHRVGVAKALGSVMLIGSSILKHGTEAQKAQFLPIIRAGELNFCLGYSEPEAGSDLASLRTSAVRNGDDWVINGQKTWTTGAHVSDWVWLAARTDPNAIARQAGITVFLFRLDSPGVTVQQHIALSGEVSCTVFYDDVRVPDSARVGNVNGGWAVIVDALAGERITMGNIAAALHRQLDDLLDFVGGDPERLVGPRGSAKRVAIGDLATRVQATRALVGAAVRASSSDIGAMFDAAMAGVMAGELAEDFGEAALSIFGPSAALSGDGTDAAIPGGGAFEYGLRQSIMYVVGGGTNDVQRGLIARGLGLPR